MDFSACVISKGLGPAPVKLGDSSFSTGLQIKQSCRAKQNPLQSYFPPSVWPDKIQGNHFNPEAFPDQETLDQSDWRKGPINTLSEPFLKLSTSSVGVREKLQQTSRLSQQESRFTSSARPTLSERTPWTENICFLNSVFYFSPLLQSDTFHSYWQHPEFPHWFNSFQVSWQTFSFTLVLCSPVARSPRVFQLLSAGLLSPLTSLLRVAAVAGSSGPHGGTPLNYPLSKRPEEDHKIPKPSCLDGNPTPAGLCETGRHRKATDYGLHCHTIFSNTTVVLGCLSSTLRLLGDKSQNISRSEMKEME